MRTHVVHFAKSQTREHRQINCPAFAELRNKHPEAIRILTCDIAKQHFPLPRYHEDTQQITTTMLFRGHLLTLAKGLQTFPRIPHIHIRIMLRFQKTVYDDLHGP